MIPQTNKIYQGDCREIMSQWDDECIDMVITSPPYWSLRDYKLKPLIWDGSPYLRNCEHRWELKDKNVREGICGAGTRWQHQEAHNICPNEYDISNCREGEKKKIKIGFCSICGAWKGQLGLEPTFDLYIKHLCDIFDEVKRVLKKEGSIWVNMGDTYNSHSAISKNVGEFEGKQMRKNPDYASSKIATKKVGIPDKSLCCIPDRFKIEMINRGWILRNTIIWHKPNPMPSSAKDRFTVDFEYLFFFVKNKNYYFEQQFEEYQEPMHRWGGENLKANGESEWDRGTGQETYRDRNMRPNPQGRNMRCVWTIPTMPCSEAHFAVFPEKLLMTPIEAGCPEFVCKKCGKARVKIWESEYVGSSLKRGGHDIDGQSVYNIPHENAKQTFKGYTNCGCGAGFEGGIVLDPFAGRGTTGIVAQKLGRRYILIDLSPEYIEMAKRNLNQGWLI